MGEAALSYWLEEFVNPSAVVAADAELQDYTALPAGETEEDWLYGSD